MSASPTSRRDRAITTLTTRVQRNRAAHYAQRQRLAELTKPLRAGTLLSTLRHLPVRILLHALVAALVPLAALASQALPAHPFERAAAPPPEDARSFVDSLLAIGPLDLHPESSEPMELPVPDSAFAEIQALPEAQIARSRQELLAPLTLSTTVVGAEAHVRNGPGLAYDTVGKLAAGAPLTLEAVAGEWFAARTAEGQRVWIAAELVANASVGLSLLAPAVDIPPPPPPKVAVVGEEGLNLRDGPGKDYVKIDSLKLGTTIDLLSRYEDWFEVRHPSGAVGWVTGDFLQIADGVIPRLEVLTSAPDPHPALIATAEGTANLRGGPGTAYPKLSSVAGGTQLELLARYKDWLKVRAGDGRSAWVFNDVVSVSDYVVRRVPVTRDIPAPPRQAAAASAARGGSRSAPPLSAEQAGSVVNFAMQFRGTPYVWGGASPGGFDCSGFVSYVYRQFGLSLPRSAASQYNQRYGTFIDRGSLQPGDIVFFANTYKRGLSHVGIYVGGGMVVQALAPGTPLSAVSMNGAYWNSKYYGAMRPNL